MFFCIFCNIFSHNYLSICAAAGIPCGVCITLNVVSMMTLLWASLAPMTGVRIFDTTERVSYTHKHLTPLFGVTMTPSFLQCSQHIIISSYFVAIFFCIVAFSCICLQPYKDKHSNNLTAGLLVLFSLLGISVIGIESQQRDGAEVFMAILILVPHSVFWGYIVWRVIKCCRCQTQAHTETQQFLHSYSETPKYSAINKTASTE